jgi:isopentenyl diphosphate isomerase/L-lactate dehydrogenase-like FMN-dependent dehydrogenase
VKAWNIEELRRQARGRLPRAVFDFIDGGAEDEGTLRENRAARSW